MRKIKSWLILLLLPAIMTACKKEGIKQPIEYVNPFIGTGAHGHTYPGATTPFGLVQLSPDTYNQKWDWCSGYHYSDSSIMGFSHTHLSGTGVADLCDILVMPTRGELKFEPGSRENPDEGYRSRFSHDNETATAGYYSVYLKDYDIQAEMTTSMRVGAHRYTSGKAGNVNMIIDLTHTNNPTGSFYQDEVLEAYIHFENDTIISGYKRSTGWAHDQTAYFYMVLSQPYSDFGILANDSLLGNSTDSVSNKHVKGYFSYHAEQGEAIELKVGISTTSLAGARKNLESETPEKWFNEIHAEAKKSWSGYLNRIDLKASEKQKEIFYTALYHTLVVPNVISDVDGYFWAPDTSIHYSDKPFYSTFSLWDTYRAAHPFYTIFVPEKNIDFINSMLLQYDLIGRTPVWPLWGLETDCMIANHSIPVIVDAYLKGHNGFDAEKALEAIKSTSQVNTRVTNIDLYKEYGYLPCNLEEQSVSKTQEISFNDWCVAQMAKELGQDEDYEYYIKRAQNYKTLFNPYKNIMYPKDDQGNWLQNYDPLKQYRPGHVTEGNSWQYTWSAQHDIEGLIQLMGGKKGFIQKLDSLFTLEVNENVPGDITGLIGQYAHGNEPSHHVAYLYNYVNQSYKTQKYVRQVMDMHYDNTPEGLSGNEDCGQMSAWYLLSALGFYPVNPVGGEYALGSPVVDEASIKLENGKVFNVKAINNSEKNVYVKSVSLNGKKLENIFIQHEDIMQGGNLVFEMSHTPVLHK